MAKFDVKRMMVEAAVSKAVSDLREKPEQTIDRYLKQTLHTHKRPESSESLERLRALLHAPDGRYRTQLCRSAQSMSAARLRALCLLAYDATHEQAERREQAALQNGVHIPALLCVDMGGNMTVARVHALVEQGQALGLGLYALFCDSEREIAALPALFSAFPGCIFLLSLRPQAISQNLVEAWRGHLNLIPFVQTMHKEGSEALSRLVQAGFLCGSAFSCTASTLALLENDTYRQDAAAAQAPLALVRPEGLSRQERARMHALLAAQREGQKRSVLPVDLWADGIELDRLQGGRAALLHVDVAGQCHYYEENAEKIGGNFCDRSFLRILEAI